MTRLWLRVAVATMAIGATLTMALDTFVVGPATVESNRAAAASAAVEAHLAARLIQRGGIPSTDATIVGQHSRPETVVASAPLDDGRMVRVPVHTAAALSRGLWRGLLLVLGTGALAGAGWALWTGLARTRDLEQACRTIRSLGGGSAVDEAPLRSTSTEPLVRAVDALRATLLHQAQSQVELVGIVAHDLRSPLTGICLAGDRLERATDSIERARARALIQRECDRLAAIADDVLQLCRETNSAVVSKGQKIAADQLLLDVAERLRGGEHASPQIDLTQAPSVRVSVDASVARAVANLAENAARHAPPGTQISLGVTQVESGAIEFVVEDAGAGFDAGSLGAAFGQGSDCPGRAGLGLASVRRVAAAVGGEARFESRPGGGTRVALRIPQTDGAT